MAKKKDPSGQPEELLALYDKLIATIPDLQRKGKANPYTSKNGHMFSFLDKEGKLSIRLSKEEQELFLKKYNAELSIQYGSVMRGYVVVPDDMMDKFKTLSKYFGMSYDFVSSLKPKPTKKKK